MTHIPKKPTEEELRTEAQLQDILQQARPTLLDVHQDYK